MYGLSKMTALILAFSIGIAVGAGALSCGVAIALSTFTVRDLERNGVPIPDEAFIGENPEVDILDLTVLDLFDEFKALQNLGDELTINLLKERYAIILPDIAYNLLSEETRNIPIGKLFGDEGINTILSTVYIGSLEQYECRLDTDDGFIAGDPADQNSYWVNAEGNRVSILEEKIADYNLADFMQGNINTNDILSTLTIGDILGYTQREGDDSWYDSDGNKVTGIIASFADKTVNNIGDGLGDISIGELLGYSQDENGKWIDSDGNKVSGVLTIFADCGIDGVADRMKDAKLAELLGYELDNGKWVNSNGEELTGALAALADCNLEGDNSVTNKINTVQIGNLLGYELRGDNKWYETVSGSTEATAVTGFMNKIASSNLDNVGNVFNTLVVSDIISDEDMDKGIFGLIPGDTSINDIGSTINETIKDSPLQFFIDQNFIEFTEAQQALLDTYDSKTNVTAEKYSKYYSGYSAAQNTDGTYSIPVWRTKSLNESFSYILDVLSR